MATTSKKTGSSQTEKAAGSRTSTGSKSKTAKSDGKAPGSGASNSRSSSAARSSKTTGSKGGTATASKTTSKKATGAKPSASGRNSAAKSGATGKTSASGSSKSAGTSKSATASKSSGRSSSSSVSRSGAATKQAKPTAAKGGSKSSGGASRSTKSPKSNKPAASTRTSGKKGIVDQISDAVGSFLAGGQQDVLDLLKEDHQRVDAHFKKVQAAEDANHQSVFKKIKAELDLHAHVEESIFYPRLMEAGSEELKKIVREGVEEHAQVKTLLAELSELKGNGKVFKAKLKVLMENVEHHVEEEENEMFPLVEDELGEEERVELAERIQKEKAKVSGKTPAGRSTGRTKR